MSGPELLVLGRNQSLAAIHTADSAWGNTAFHSNWILRKNVIAYFGTITNYASKQLVEPLYLLATTCRV